ncbi:MAG TPA: hypothetical protein VKY65_19155 [Alphaproteobacteria bacterium]|nr:hypothetical protein [Alphaproteobacteria bacterium]
MKRPLTTVLLAFGLTAAPGLGALAQQAAAPPVPVKAAPAKSTAAVANGAAHESSGAPLDTRKPLDRYITLEPLLLSIIRHQDVHKIVSLLVTVELADPEKRYDLELRLPILRDAYISNLTRLLSLGFYDNRNIDIALVKRRLLAVSRKVLGQGVVRDVLITNVLERAV